MSALTKAYEAYERPGLVVAYKMSNVKIWKGALVGVNASGFLVPMAHGTANLKFVGVASESVDNLSGSAGGVSLNVTKSGSFVFAPQSGFTPAVTDLGKEAFAYTDNDIQVSTTGLTSQYKVGTIVAMENSSVGVAGIRVRIDNYTL